MILQPDLTIDTTNMSTVLASILILTLAALGYMYKIQLTQHKEALLNKDDIIKAKDETINKITEAKKLAEDRLDKEQEYTKQTAVQVTGVLKDNTTALIHLSKTSDQIIEIKPTIEKSNDIIKSLTQHNKEMIANQQTIINNQSKFIPNGKGS